MTVGPGPLSPRNKRVTAARRLLKRGFRDTDRAFLAEGPQAVREALAGLADDPRAVRELFVTSEAAAAAPRPLAQATTHGIPVHTLPEAALAELSGTVTPQGLVAVCPFLDVPLDHALAARPRLVTVLAAGPRPRQRRHGDPRRPTPPEPVPWC